MTDQPNTPPTAETDTAVESSDDRRGFVRFLAVVIGGAITAVPAVLGTIFFLDPLFRKKQTVGSGADETSPGEGYLKTTSLESIPADGEPVFEKVKKDIVDAWNVYLDQPVGAVFLRKNADGDVIAYNSECPHLGCAVDYNESEHEFICPCHESQFSLQGVASNTIPPRGLDELDVKVTENGEVWVKFQSFKNGVPEKIPKS